MRNCRDGASASEGGGGDINLFGLLSLATRITNITENATALEVAGRERQERMWRNPQAGTGPGLSGRGI